MNIDEIKKLGYNSSKIVSYRTRGDEMYQLFFSSFQQVEKDYRNEFIYLFKPYAGEIQCLDENDNEIEKGTIKAIGIVEIDLLSGELNRSVFQLLDRQMFFYKQEMDMLNTMYDKFFEEVGTKTIEEEQVERC